MVRLASAFATTAVAGSVVAVLMTSQAVAIGPINPLDPAEGFSVFLAGDATVTSNENEGTMAVGGDLTIGGNYQLNNRGEATYVAPGDTDPTALVVGGQVNFADSTDGVRLQVEGGGFAKVGDLSNAFIRDTDNNGADVSTRVLPEDDYEALPHVELTTRQPPESVAAESGLDFSAAFDEFRSISAELAACAGTVQLVTANGEPWNREPESHINLMPGMTNVLNISAEDLDQIAILTFNDAPTADTPLLVNVDTSGVGGVFDWSPPSFAGVGPSHAPYILFNFAGTTELNLVPGGGGVIGTIYAPDADVTDQSSTNIDGAVIANSLDHNGGELHPESFDTELECEPPATPTPTPTPSESPSPTPTPSPSEPPGPTPTPSPSEPPGPTPTSSEPPHWNGLPATSGGLGWLLWLGAGVALLGGAALTAGSRPWRRFYP
jgi:choice-of-anchor A domain-containing protein